PILHIDAFTREPFGGNPAAVCLMEGPREAEWMQRVAAEMNLSETAFVWPRERGGGFDLRWFTPEIEIPLCGHATLASAHALWETGLLDEGEEARFETMSGPLTCRELDGRIEMDFPALMSIEAKLPRGAKKALGVVPEAVRLHRRANGTDGNYLIELATEADVREAKPDFGALRGFDAGFIITARGESGRDFVSRYFAGFAGIDEDPVTGSAHCMLTPYWAEKLGKAEMSAYQASKRGGEIGVRMNGDRVTLIGGAVTVLRGTLAC
ncbi:MAG: PhzF family phenazine biosynthesis protein, partial [Blastocatellia bacterium]